MSFGHEDIDNPEREHCGELLLGHARLQDRGKQQLVMGPLKRQ